MDSVAQRLGGKVITSISLIHVFMINFILRPEGLSILHVILP